MENLLAKYGRYHAEGRQGRRYEDNAQLAVMSKRLATINTNVPCRDRLSTNSCWESRTTTRWSRIYTKLEFNKFLKKLNVGREGGQSDQAAVRAASIRCSWSIRRGFERILVNSDEMLKTISSQRGDECSRSSATTTTSAEPSRSTGSRR